MASLSTGKCQRATRKAVVDILLNSTSLRGQFHEVDALVKILGWKCGIVGIDDDTILRAFKCSDNAYSVELKDMGVGHDGDDVLYVYKNYQIADGTRITTMGVFESVEVARSIDIADPKQRDGLLQNTSVQLDDALERQLRTELAKAAKGKARKEEGADEKRPSSAKEEQPPQKRTRIPTPDTTSEQTDMHDVAATATIAIGDKSRTLTIAVGSPLYNALLEQFNLDSEEEAANEDVNCASETAGEVRSENTREYRTTCRDVTVGSHTMYEVPSHCEVVCKNHLSQLKANSACIDRLRKLFKKVKSKTDDPEKDRERCALSDTSLLFLAGASLQNSGGSDNGTVTVIAATMTVLLKEMGVDDISAECIANACPSETTIAEYEYHLATHCMLLATELIKSTESKSICLTSDKGHRKGSNHLVKTAHVAAKNMETGERTLNHIVIDVDECGGTSEDAAAAIKHGLKPYKKLIPDLRVQGLTGDSGGGGSVQTLVGPLKGLGVMDKDGKHVGCDMHAFAKPLEKGGEYAMGKQGLGQNTVFQLCYSAIWLFRKLKEQGGNALVDEILTLVREKLHDSQEWKDEADEICKQAYDDYIARLASEEEDDDDEDEVSGFRNLQLPVFSRWTSVLKGLVWLRDHYVVIYFTAVAIIQKEGSKSSMYKTAVDIVALMSMRPDIASAEATDATVESAIAGGGLRPGDSPVLLPQIHFLCAFGDAFYTAYFTMAMQADPLFGTDSHGHLSRRLVSRGYVMMKELRDMIHDNNWQQLPAFASYMKSIEGLPRVGDKTKPGREMMDAIAEAFFEQYLASAIKHLETQWTSDMLLPFLIGDVKELRQEFLLLLQACEDGRLEAGSFDFSNKVVEVENVKAYGEGHEVHVGDAMRYLTGKANVSEILKDPLIQKEKDLLFQTLEAPEVVDFFDEGTWDGVDYGPIVDLIHEYIVPHASNQQRIEGFVQMINIMARSNVKGGRRSARLIIFSILFHPYNRASVDEKQKERATIADKKKVKRVKGAERLAGLLPHLYNQIEGAHELKEALPEGLYNEVFLHYKTGNKKKRAEVVQTKKDEMVTALAKARKINRNQRNAKAAVPLAVGGAIEFIWFAACRESTAPSSLLRIEIAHRGIKIGPEGRKVTLRLDEEPLASMSLPDMKEELKKDELARMAREDNVKEGKKVEKVNSFKPQSQAMIEKIPAFLDWKQNRL